MLKDLNITKNCTNNEYIVDALKKTKTILGIIPGITALIIFT